MNKKILLVFLTQVISLISAGFDHDDSIRIIPRAIQSPIFNLPFQESLWEPLHLNRCGHWGLCFAPFLRVQQQDNRSNFKETEEGFMLAGHIGSHNVWLESLFLFGNNKTTFNHKRYDYYFSSNHFGTLDALIGIGATAYHDPSLHVEVKGLWGVSDKRFDGAQWIASTPHQSVGLQSSAHYCLRETSCSQTSLIGLFRWLYFFKHTLNIAIKDSYSIESRSEKHCTIRPGFFLDFMLGFRHRWGENYDHEIELGYDPTINVGGSLRPAALVYDSHKIPFNHGDGRINMTRQAIYGNYFYKHQWSRVLLTWSLGASINVQRITDIDESPATIWTILWLFF